MNRKQLAQVQFTVVFKSIIRSESRHGTERVRDPLRCWNSTRQSSADEACGADSSRQKSGRSEWHLLLHMRRSSGDASAPLGA